MNKLLKKTGTRFSEALEIPKDIIMDVPKIIITGDDEITIENHKGILDFEQTLIRINSKIGAVLITGTSFEIKFIADNTIIIGGKFKTVQFEGAF